MTAKTTESAGWSVSVTDVSAAGSRGRAAAIRSQPTTCEVSARRTSHPCSGQVGRSSSSPRPAPTGRVTIAAESVAFWLVYRSAQVALSEKQIINGKLLDAQYADRQNQLTERTKARYLTLPHPRTPAGLILTRRFRTLLDFWLPTALGVGAIVAVIVRTRYL